MIIVRRIVVEIRTMMRAVIVALPLLVTSVIAQVSGSVIPA
jgi:hypothetical protein